MIKVSIDAFRDFQACGLYYQYKHLDHLREGRETQLKKTQMLFKDTLLSIINFFFYRKMQYAEPTYKSLESKWEKKWLKEVGVEDVVLQPNSAHHHFPTDAFYTRKATAALVAFHKWFYNRNNQVVLLDEPFTVPINDDVAVDDRFDLVLRSPRADGGWKYHIYVWAFNEAHRPSDYWSAHFTVLDYAFRYRNNFDPNLDISYYLWDYTDNEPGVREFLVEIGDHQVLQAWAKRMVVGVENKLYHPIRSLSAYCKGCKFDKECRNWEPKKDD